MTRCAAFPREVWRETTPGHIPLLNPEAPLKLTKETFLKPTQAISKADATTQAARTIIDAKTEERHALQARLRAARLEAEAKAEAGETSTKERASVGDDAAADSAGAVKTGAAKAAGTKKARAPAKKAKEA